MISRAKGQGDQRPDEAHGDLGDDARHPTPLDHVLVAFRTMSYHG
jgi:hypothetical protein